MCGIAGIASTRPTGPEDSSLVRSMLGALAHRGPDDEHVIDAGGAVLGARRLSIIDLEGGRQPLTNENGDVLVSQNGEIYNYVELGEELVRSGHTLRTRSDTEIIAHLYEEAGLDFVKRLRGMFAIALYDRSRQRLVLARDRLGKKPLYWQADEDGITWGSELKSLLVRDGQSRQVDRAALARYLRYQYVPAPATILEGISKLEPASVLVWEQGRITTERYWSPTYQPKLSGSLEEHAEQARELLREAVRIRLRSDVPVGVFLSGGIDSSIVTALMAEQATGTVQSFSIGFESEAHDELPHARRIAERYGTDHTEAIVRMDAVEMLPALAVAFDEPFADGSSLPTFRVAQIAASKLKVVLTGDGGDESFGGYNRYVSLDRLAWLDRLPPGSAALAARAAGALESMGLAARSAQRLRAMSSLGGRSAGERYEAMMATFTPAEVDELLAGDGHVASEGYVLSRLAAGEDELLDRVLRADLLTYLPEDLLVKMDRATMANSLEARSPLLDQEVAAFGARLPLHEKVAGSTTKVLLRHIAADLLPADLVERRKHGFGVPLDDWFRGALGERFTELVLAPDAASRDHLDTRVGERLLERHRSGATEAGKKLWTLLMFEAWARAWLRPA